MHTATHANRFLIFLFNISSDFDIALPFRPDFCKLLISIRQPLSQVYANALFNMYIRLWGMAFLDYIYRL